MLQTPSFLLTFIKNALLFINCISNSGILSLQASFFKILPFLEFLDLTVLK